METILLENTLTETYNDMQGLINKVVWKFYEKYGGDFEEWKAEANLIFIQAYNSHRDDKGQFSTWLYFCIWKRLLDYAKVLYKQVPYPIEFNDRILDGTKTYSFSSLELLDGIGDDTKTLIYLIWNLPHNLPIRKGNNNCHIKVALRNYLRGIGWTLKRIKESFKEIGEIINDN